MNLKSESGFTLLEAMVALMMTASILLLLMGSLLQADAINQKMVSDAQFYEETQDSVVGDRQIEWHLFLNQLENYLQGSVDPVVGENYLEVKEMDEETNRLTSVVYKQPDSGSKRTFLQYKNNGKIRMLTGVEKVDFSRENGWLTLNFKFRNNQYYTGRIWVESWIKEKEEVEEIEEIED